MPKNNNTAIINVDKMLLLIFDSFDSMTFVRAEASKDEVPLIFRNNTK